MLKGLNLNEQQKFQKWSPKIIYRLPELIKRPLFSKFVGISSNVRKIAYAMKLHFWLSIIGARLIILKKDGDPK